ncbi:glycerophosphodiester phosphodiesterase [Haloplanus halobius]|uniref:glycerophosphodiester phosphodiesterase n=1 Tax=Haloplanus halobius TaxID=2934938 RepID=UPI00200E75FB|nr:glycerophosphodiester phosphodiesterase [Haloplanus sp. XH21]
MTDPMVIAHRGFAGVTPENTIRAVNAAAPDADMVEIDVVACADGTPVVFHDHRLGGESGSRGITDGHGAVADLPPETVTAAEVLESGETVPTFDDLLDATDAPLNVELKRPAAGDDAPRERWQPFVDRVLDAIDGREIRLSSFREGALAAVRERDSTVPLAPLSRDAATAAELADWYDAGAVHLSRSAVDEAVVEAAHDAGRTVAVWTIRTRRQAADADATGADELITDYPLHRWLGGKSG